MIDNHEHLDEGTIHAWLDGALPPDESTRVELLAVECPACAALVAEARGLVAASSRILSALDAVPGGVIPGATSNTDQLAMLRARRREAAPRWWRDRRILAAASLIFVAGVTTLVARSPNRVSPSTGAESLSDAARPAAPPPSVVAEPRTDSVTPASPSVASTRRDAKAVNAPAPSPQPVASLRRDSQVVAKVAAAAPRERDLVANEAARVDSNVLRRRADSVVAQAPPPASPEVRLRQEGTRQSVQQFQIDSTRAARSRAQLGASPMRLGEIVTTGVGAAADVANAASVCFALRQSAASRAAWVPDRVKLFSAMIPILSDPSWFHAEALRATRDSLFWRDADSVTVELRRRLDADSGAVLFTRDGSPVRARGMGNATPISASRITCP